MGIVGVAGSVAWWYAFYSKVMRLMDIKGSPPPFECLYATAGECGMVAGIARAMGSSAYDPMLLWGSLGLLAIGLVARFLAAIY